MDEKKKRMHVTSDGIKTLALDVALCTPGALVMSLVVPALVAASMAAVAVMAVMLVQGASAADA